MEHWTKASGEARGPIRGGRLGVIDAPASRTYASKRVCLAPDCGTLLSIYNEASFCWLHDVAHPFVLRTRRRTAGQGSLRRAIAV